MTRPASELSVRGDPASTGREIGLSPQARAVWNTLSRLEQMRVDLAVRRMSVERVRMRAGPFTTETYGIVIDGTFSDWGSNAMIHSLTRDPDASPKR